MSTSCAAARAAIYARDFIDWHGLPRECSPRDLVQFEATSYEELARRTLGDDFEAGKFALVEVPG